MSIVGRESSTSHFIHYIHLISLSLRRRTDILNRHRFGTLPAFMTLLKGSFFMREVFQTGDDSIFVSVRQGTEILTRHRFGTPPAWLN